MMLDLALNNEKGYIALKDIGERQDISKKYLEQIVPMLNRAGFLLTNRGYQGGYMLAKKPSEYSVGEILRVTEGELCPVACLGNNAADCARAGECMTLGVWKGLHKAITDYLDNISLQDIINENGGDFTL